MTPSQGILAKQQCDIEETLWIGESSTQVVMCNWGLESQTIDRGQAVGEVQLGTVVDEDDTVWSDTSMGFVCSKSGMVQLIIRGHWNCKGSYRLAVSVQRLRRSN